MSAISSCLRLLIDPEHVSVYRFRAVIYSDKKLFEKAEADFNKCIELNPRGMMPYYNRAKFYESIGKNKEALADYDRVIVNARRSGNATKEEDRQAVVFKHKAKLLSKMGRLEEAIDSISAAIAINKLLPEDYTIRGELYLELREYDKALADFNQALELSPTMAPEAYLGRASAYEHLGKKELADRSLLNGVFLRRGGRRGGKQNLRRLHQLRRSRRLQPGYSFMALLDPFSFLGSHHSLVHGSFCCHCFFEPHVWHSFCRTLCA